MIFSVVSFIQTIKVVEVCVKLRIDVILVFSGCGSSHGEVQPVGGLAVSGAPIRCHGLQVGHHRGSSAEEGGRTVRTGGSLCCRRTSNFAFSPFN